jgi:calcium-dependent protein kinase
VYKAKKRDTGDIKAIKAIPRDKIKDEKRFRNEVEALKTLDHPNVIRLYEIFEDDKRVYLV